MAKGVEELLAAMKAQPESAVAQRNGAILLVQALATQDAKVASRVLAAAGAPTLVAAVQGHPGDAQVQRWCANALASVLDSATDEAGAATAILELGGLQAALQALQQHEDAPDTQRWLLAELGSLVERSGGAAAETLVELQPGFATVVDCCSKHPDCTVLQLQAVRLLGLCALDSTEAAAALLGSSRALWIVVETMRRLGCEPDLQKWGLATVWAMAEHLPEEAAKAFQAADGLDVLLTAMQTHSGSSELQRWACAALWAVASGGAAALAVEMGAVQAVVTVMEACSQAEDVQERGLGALCALVKGGGNLGVQAVVDLGGVDVGVKAATLHPDSQAVASLNDELTRLVHERMEILEGSPPATDDHHAADGARDEASSPEPSSPSTASTSASVGGSLPPCGLASGAASTVAEAVHESRTPRPSPQTPAAAEFGDIEL